MYRNLLSVLDAESLGAFDFRNFLSISLRASPGIIGQPAQVWGGHFSNSDPEGSIGVKQAAPRWGDQIKRTLETARTQIAL